MKSSTRILWITFNDVLRSKWLIIYSLFFFVLTESLFRFGGEASSVILSLSNVVLILIPLLNMLFGIIYIYHSRSFIEMILSQPIARFSIFLGLYFGLIFPAVLGFAGGIGLALLINIQSLAGAIVSFVYLLLTGSILTGIFIGFSFYLAMRFEDKLKGLGLGILFWLFFSIIYDGIILFLLFVFSDYPLEKIAIFSSFLNPISLARVLMLLQMDISALMGYTGAVFHHFFGTALGSSISALVLMVWLFIPFFGSFRLFVKKDF